MVPAPHLAKDAALLALGSVGALTAWAHNRSSLLDFLVARNIAGLSAAARHLLGARVRATADLSGLLEGFGIISVTLLFAGPLEVRPLPALVYALGTVLIVIHVWSAFLQAMTDSTWYVPDPPPGRAVLVLRPLMPLIVATILFAILAYPVYWQHQAVPGGLFGVILAAAVVLLLWPYTLIYELVLRGARDAAALGPPVPGRRRHHRAQPGQERGLRVSRDGQQPRGRAGDQGAGPGDAGADRGGRPWSSAGPPNSAPSRLWHCVTRILPSGADTTAQLDPASRSVQLSGTDYQLARRCLVDLMTNAWKAGARQIEVAISMAEQPGAARAQTVLRVDDEGRDAGRGAGQSGHEPGRDGRAPGDTRAR